MTQEGVAKTIIVNLPTRSITMKEYDTLTPMKIPESYLLRDSHRELIAELLSLDTAEDRLSFLMERPPLHPALPEALRTSERKVPGCLSGLWLYELCEDGICRYSAYSESSLVQGVVSFLCDVYSDRTPEEITEIGDLIARAVNLEGLLSLTRKRASSSTVNFILHTAARHLVPQPISA